MMLNKRTTHSVNVICDHNVHLASLEILYYLMNHGPELCHMVSHSAKLASVRVKETDLPVLTEDDFNNIFCLYTGAIETHLVNNVGWGWDVYSHYTHPHYAIYIENCVISLIKQIKLLSTNKLYARYDSRNERVMQFYERR